MKLSDKILVVAKWLESENNELLVEANETQMDKLALSLICAADALKEAVEDIKASEPVEQINITPEKLEEIAAVAASFDESDDEFLRKQASVLDEILQTFAAPKDYIFNFKKAEEDKLEEIRKNYKAPKEEMDETIGVKEALDAIKKSPVYQDKRPLEAPLSARSCPDHAGAQMARVGDNRFQCSLDHKIYDFNAGYALSDGTKVPPGSVAEQTPKYYAEGHQIFDSRAQRLGAE